MMSYVDDAGPIWGISDDIQAEALESVVTQAGTAIDRHVVDVLLEKFHLGAHIGAIKRYLLLGQAYFHESHLANLSSMGEGSTS